MHAVNFNDVSFSYHRSSGWIRGFQFQFVGGCSHALVGRSGVGKSTLMKLAMGLLKPMSGSVTLGQSRVSTERKIGYVAQDYALFPWLTVAGNIELGAHQSGAPIKDNRRRVNELALRFGIGDSLASFPRELSGGMQQRASLARALCGRPELLCLDEPFSALDIVSREQTKQVLSEAFEDNETTVLFISHDISEAVQIADYVHLLRESGDGLELISFKLDDFDSRLLLVSKITDYVLASAPTS